MSSEVVTGVFGLLGALVGGGITAVVTMRAQTVAQQTERERRADEAKAVEAAEQRDVVRRTDAFQTDTLLELQMALQREMRAAASIHGYDLVQHRTTGAKWGRAKVPPAMNTESFLAGNAVVLLNARVRDDAVRAAVTAAHEHISSLAVMATDEADANARLHAATEAFLAAGDAIGSALRALPPPMAPPARFVTQAVAPHDLALPSPADVAASASDPPPSPES